MFFLYDSYTFSSTRGLALADPGLTEGDIKW
jgi:hypothetical protein